MTHTHAYDNFEQNITIPSGSTVEQWRLELPAKHACFIILNEEGAPLKLATTGNLRQAVISHFQKQTPTHELDDQSEQSKTSQMYACVEVKQTITVKYTLTANNLESELAYHTHATVIAKQDHRQFLKLRKVYWVTLNPDAVPLTWKMKSSRQLDTADQYIFGPYASQNKANSIIECLQDLFDLCRYPDELAKAPHGKACVYEEMNKCPAPCDGRISLEAYQGQIDESLAVMTHGPERWIENTQQQMQQAADGLQFELAARLKHKLERAGTLTHPSNKHISELKHIKLLTRQPGSTATKQRLLFVTPNHITMLGEYAIKAIEAQTTTLHEKIVERLNAVPALPQVPPSPAFDIALYHFLNDKYQRTNWLRVDSELTPEALRTWLSIEVD